MLSIPHELSNKEARVSLGLQDRRDVEFLVRDVLKVGQVFDLPLYKGQDWETFEMVLDNAIKFAHEQVQPTNIVGDREGLRFDGGAVTTPAAFRPVYEAWREGGWIAIAESEEHGGIGLPRALAIHPVALLVGANVALFTLPGLCHGAGEMIAFAGNAAQKALFVPKLFSGEWGGTMCLTEPSAGSDVGAARTTAVQQPDGTWHIKGQKIFITWGEHDLTENIVYPVLARVEGDPAGTGGLSLFLVTKHRIDAQGKAIGRNGVKCAGIEHKMGIHGSPTCTMIFGEDAPAVGELLGEQRGGMKVMFKMMNTARIAVGLQAVALAEGAYRYAHQYALDRLQGSAPENFKNAAAPRISIVKHGDVRRMLLDMRTTVEGLRALMTFCALQHDISLGATGEAAERAEEIVGLLTPLCKGYASEVGFEAVSTSITVLGGHGFLRDHPLEQYLRDTVIARLYEGTTGIQSLDLVARKLGRRGGMALMDLLGRFDETIERARGAGLGALADSVQRAREMLGDGAMHLAGMGMSGDVAGPTLVAVPFMFLMGDAVMCWLHLWMATEAAQAADRTTFHKNKIAGAKHYIVQAEARIAGRLAALKADDRSAYDYAFEGE
jgi:alkylation response protein AidB-like acyl-CoA dehydrogenase